MPRLVRIMWPFVLGGIGLTLAGDHPSARVPWTVAALACAGYGIYNLQRMQGRPGP
jgi:hypothetical protein